MLCLPPPWEGCGSPTLSQDYLGSVLLQTEYSPLSLLGQLSAPLGHGVLGNDYRLLKEHVSGLERAFRVCSEYKAKENTEIRVRTVEMKRSIALWERLRGKLLWE